MILSPFEYHAPTTIEEALRLLSDYRDDSRILAGGQSLIPLLKLNLVEVGHIVDIKHIPELSSIGLESDPEGRELLRVGALTRHSDIERSEIVRKAVPLLAETAAGIGHQMVRNRGTIGGSLAHSDPSADLCTASIALDATINTVSAGGKKRMVKADEFFEGPLSNCLSADELIESVTFPSTGPGSGYSIKKFTLGTGDFPIVVVCALATVKDERLAAIAISIGGVGGTPLRLKDAEQALLSAASPGILDIRTITGEAASSLLIEDDPRVSAPYKRKLAATLLGRSVAEAIGKAGGIT